MTDQAINPLLTEQVDAMTLKRSTARTAELEPARPAHLRVCPPPPDSPQAHDNPFTPDELALISLFADGLCIEAIARRLDLSDRTIRRRSRALCDRLGVVSTIQVVAWAARRQLI
ncbi:LuxR C-terminal-related transcriptional regulator [Haloactinopolyspora sp.]|uniref:LuxR C-terminal-related transcriptional regulator n=1 Tax=Haloactinopolyspora sp. TaxID=1966353 RepID=UPI002612DE3D|nr:LuxR C-terminal-related transcriptional regulator [Haloactinopolyspora sp.]